MKNLLNKFKKGFSQRGLLGISKMVCVFIKKHTWASPGRRKSQLISALKVHSEAYRKIGNLVIPGTGGGLHPKHRIMNYHKFFVDHIGSDDIVLDFGCGNGALTFSVAKKAREIVGIDFDAKHIAQAKRNFSRENIKYIVGDVLEYDFNKKFNKIILSNVLEHIKDRVKLLKNLQNITEVILLRVPMITRDWLVVFKKEMNLEYKLDSTHETEFTSEQLQDELAQAGWKIQDHQIIWGEFWGVIVKE